VCFNAGGSDVLICRGLIPEGNKEEDEEDQEGEEDDDEEEEEE
jgi:hypothetical protein